MNLPKNFEWLTSVGVLPKMVAEGLKLLGIKEIPGAQNNPQILGFASALQLEKIYVNEDMPWCALANNYIAEQAGKRVRMKDPYDLLRALAFLKNGVSENVDDWEVIADGQAVLGDTLVFARKGGGHEGLYIGESETHFYVMGGNQGNMYSFTRVSKDRLAGVRRPKYKNGMPVSARKYLLTDSGTPVTTNEA